MALIFEWDPRKAASNRIKHAVTFEEAATVFGDPLGRISADPRHSAHEERAVILGVSNRRRFLVVMFVDRDGIIRVISARRATPRERRTHEEKD